MTNMNSRKNGRQFARSLRGLYVPALLGSAMLVGGAVAAPQQSRPVANAGTSANAFQQQATRLGVQRCTNAFAALGQGATIGANYAVQVAAHNAAPNAHAVVGLAGMTYQTPEYSGPAAGVVTAAPVGQGCEGQMVRVTPFQKPCPEVVKMLPGGSTVAANLSGVPLYNLGGNQGQAMLLASGNVCVVVAFVTATAT